MSQITDEAISYIKKSTYSLLITVSEDKRPLSRYIEPVVTNGLDIYFVTRSDSYKIIKDLSIESTGNYGLPCRKLC